MTMVWFLVMIVVNTRAHWVSPHTYETEEFCNKVGFTTVAMARDIYPSQPLMFACTRNLNELLKELPAEKPMPLS